MQTANVRLEGANVLKCTNYELNICTKNICCTFMYIRIYNHRDYKQFFTRIILEFLIRKIHKKKIKKH